MHGCGASRPRGVLIPFTAAVLALALLGPAAGGVDAADGCANAAIRQHQGSSWLPECRAFEMVSPPNKNGNAVLGGYGARPGGGGFAFWSPGAFAGAASSVGVAYLAERTATGWRTTAMNPPMEGRNPNLIDEVRLMGIADDLSSVLVSTEFPVDSDDRGASLTGSGFADLYRVGTDRSVTWASHGLTLPDLSTDDVTFGGASADLSRVVFHSRRVLTPDAPSPATQPQVYEWSNGEIHLLSRDADEDPMAAGATVGQPGAAVSTPFGRWPSAVSEDASRVAFTSPPSTTSGQVYVRIDRTTTVQASASRRSVPDPNPPRTSVYRDATPDTSKVLFSSPDALTDDAIRGASQTFDHTLYLYDVESRDLTNVSPFDPAVPEAERAGGPKVRGTIGVADDGSDVYFIATSRLVAGTGPVDGQRNVYHYDREADSIRFIGIVGTTEADSPEEAELSADGERMLVRSTMSLDGGPQSGLQLYLYDVASGEVTCVSCTSHGNGLGNVNALFNGVEYAGAGPLRDYLSADGQRVFFTTMNSLVPQDVNGTADAYEWANGQLYLLTSGQHPAPSVYVGKSADDGEVFVLTNESLTGHDVDNGVADAYAVRVNGGFPEPPPASVCTTDCRAPAVVAPGAVPGSESFHGREPEPLPPRPAFSVRRPSRAELARLARGRRVDLRVRVSRAGRVALAGRARLGGRSRLVAGDAVRARRPGVVALDLRISAAARRHLARGKRLRLTVSVRFADVREARRMTLNLKGGRR